MAGFLQPVSTSQTPDAAEVQRQQQLAQMLMAQSMQPMDTQFSPQGYAVKRSPFEALSKVLTAYMGKQAQTKADDMRRQMQDAGVNDVSKFVEMLRGSPAAPTGQFQSGGNEMGDEPTTQQQYSNAQAPDLAGALKLSMASQNPMLQQAGGGLLGGLMPKSDKWGTDPRYDQNGNAYLVSEQGNVKPLPGVKARDKAEFVNGTAVNPFQTAPGTVVPQQAPQNNPFNDLVVTDAQGRIVPNTPIIEAKARIAREGATNINTYGSPVPIDLGDGRTGYLQPPTRPGGPTQVMGLPGSNKPAVKPLEPGQANRTQDAKDALGLIDMADKILKDSTGSYTGKVADVAAAAIGKSTKGAEAAQQLKVIQGMLVSKMPKMSGPQSDKDVILYQQMAGLVGDDTLPVARRQAALKTVRAIQEKYAGVQPQAETQAPPGMPGMDAIEAELAKRMGR